MKRITRDRPLTDEEAAANQVLRDQIAADLPELIASYHLTNDLSSDPVIKAADSTDRKC